MGAYELCGSVVAMQARLQTLGLYGGPLDNQSTPDFYRALQAFGQMKGLPVPEMYEARGFAVPKSPMPVELCKSLYESAEMATTPIGGPAQAPSPYRRTMAAPISSVLANRVMLTPIIGRNQAPVADEPAPPPVITYVEPTPELGWWASQAPATRYAIIGGGLLAVAGAAYYLTRSR